MLLEVRGLKVPPQYQLHLFNNDLPKDHPRCKPDYLVPLGKTLWPQDVKEKVTSFYKELGIQDPMQQKLVDPACKHFGGRVIDGQEILEFVNWFKLVDYFEWEAAAWLGSYQFDTKNMEGIKKAEALQERALNKHGGYFSHYHAYGEEIDY